MGRMPILYRNLYHIYDAINMDYGGLIHVSMGYTPVQGRLHTRYAPVRHSCIPEGTLPFDLHVLGLPLALILSQDQTLRCRCIVKIFYTELFELG